MKTIINICPRLFKILLVFFVVIISLASFAASEEICKFERMWPALQQPWYFQQPEGVAVDNDGYVFVVDTWHERIVKLTANGKIVNSVGVEGSEPGNFDHPGGIAIDQDGLVYVAERNNQRIQKFTSDLELVEARASAVNPHMVGQPEGNLAVDNQGFIYHADYHDDHIYKYRTDGTLERQWGTTGTGPGEFNSPVGIAVDLENYIYVTDYGNDRIQKFTSDGEYITEWGSEGDGAGEFIQPKGITIDSDGYVYVCDSINFRIQKFTREGNYITQWSIWVGTYEGGPRDIAVTRQGILYVTTQRSVTVFTTAGVFLEKWSARSSIAGQFHLPRGVAYDPQGYVYIVDSENERIQKFSSDGQLITTWGSYGSGAGRFTSPYDIDVDSLGNVYVVDRSNSRIQKFDSSGQYISEWGSQGSGDGQFSSPNGIAIFGTEFVYITDGSNNRIQKFTPTGQFLAEWGSSGSGDGQFDGPYGIDVDNSGNVYVVDKYNKRVQKFDSSGQFLAKWGSEGSDDGQFNSPTDIDVDDSGNVYVVDTFNNRIQKFNNQGIFLGKFGEKGVYPGQFRGLTDLAVSSNGAFYVSDYSNNRVQFLKKQIVASNDKAIIVAGGGAFAGNDLWNATQMNANFVYRALTFQGFTKDRIYYLTPDTDLDLDNNGVKDDVDGDANGSNLEQAITGWAADANSLVLYLIGPGGSETFRISDTENLTAYEIDSWLDTLQATLTGTVTVIYDACQSGSFLPVLSQPENRIVIAGTSPGESAHFVTQGSISFSNYFWTHIFNGLNVKDAFSLSNNALGTVTSYQHPLLDTNGNGLGNEPEDLTLSQNFYIGNGTATYGDSPTIGAVSAPQTVSNMNSALLYADNVTDDDGVAGVWAVISPPNFSQGSPDSPILDLPTIDLMPAGGDRFEGTFDGFIIAGTYQISIHARDRLGNTATPLTTTVLVENPLRRRAIIVASGSQADDLWPAVEKNATLAYNSLIFQGYTDDDIYFMSPVSFSADVDALATPNNLYYAVETWAQSSSQDLVLYMVGNGGFKSFQINGSVALSAENLDTWLDNLQNSISGKVTVIYDACQSGSFIPALTPPEGKNRIIIASTPDYQPAYFLSEGDISFSAFFWKSVLNGTNLNDSFKQAGKAIEDVSKYKYGGKISAQIDDSGNGISNEKGDGQLARNYTIGSGVVLSGDNPFIGSVSPEQILNGPSSAMIWADNVTTSGVIERVWAVITPPSMRPNRPDMPVADLPRVDLIYDSGSGKYEGVYNHFSNFGTYNIAVLAKDTEGNISMPQVTRTIQKNATDVYEDDDIFGSANVIVPDDNEAQSHTFHDTGDQDWVMFYGRDGETYEIESKNLGSNCDTAMALYEGDGSSLIAAKDDNGYGTGELLSWQCTEDNRYFVMLTQYNSGDYGQNTEYGLRVYRPVIVETGTLVGIVVDSSGDGVGGALVQAVGDVATETNSDGTFNLVLAPGTYTVSADKPGFGDQSLPDIIVEAEKYTPQNFTINQSKGNLILVAGGGIAAENTLKEATQYLSDLVYKVFKFYAFQDDDIYYFNPLSWHDIDGNGYDDDIVDDDSPTVTEFGQSITGWAAEQSSGGPLYIYLIDHGGVDTFLIFPDEILTASQFSGFIDTFQNATDRRVVVMIEASKAGTFTDDIVTSGQNRVMVASCDDGNAYFGSNGSISFTKFFMDHLNDGHSIYQGWLQAKNQLSAMGLPYSEQNPQLVEGIQDISVSTIIGEGGISTGISDLGPVTNIFSTSHDISTPMITTQITMTWSAPLDYPSDDISGYLTAFNTAETDALSTGNPDFKDTLTVTSSLLAEGTYYFHVAAVDSEGDPGPTASAGPYIIDPTQPTASGNLQAVPLPETWTNDNTIDVSWEGGTDSGSGVAGYSYVWDTTAGTEPDNSVETLSTSGTSSVLADGNSHWFHIRTVDNAGNSSETMHLGPFFIDTEPPTGGSVIINNDADTTGSIDAILGLSAGDIGNGMAQGKMRFSNDNVTWSNPMDYAVSANWSLLPGTGVKTVYVRFSDKAGNWTTAVVSDDIELVEAPPDPTNLELADVPKGRVDLKWDQIVNPYDVNYTVYRSKLADGVFYPVNEKPIDYRAATGGKVYFTDETVQDNKTYYYKAKSVYNNVESIHATNTVEAKPAPAFNFDIHIEDFSKIVNVGGSVTYGIHLEKRDRFSGVVNLSCTSQSSGFNYQFILNGQNMGSSLSGASIPAVVELVVSTGSTTLPGDHSFEISAQNVWEGSASGYLKKDIRLKVVGKYDNGITLALEKTEIAKGERLTILGAIYPPLADKTVRLTITQEQSPTPEEQTVSTGEGGVFKDVSWISRLEIGTYSLEAAWMGPGSQEHIASLDFRINKGRMMISCRNEASDDPEIGKDFVVIGELTPPLASESIILKMADPDGNWTELQPSYTDHNGKYRIQDNFFTRKGRWQFKAYWTGSQEYTGCESAALKVPVEADFGRAIILGGGEYYQNNTYWETTKKLITQTYEKFQRKGFTDDMIYLMVHSNTEYIEYKRTPQPIIDDHTPTPGEFISAIENHFPDLDDIDETMTLYIYMQGHATQVGSFKVLGDGDFVYAQEIGTAIGNLQTTVNCKVVVILESCYSGNFINYMKGPNRVILTSAGDAVYNTDDSGINTFSYFLFEELLTGSDFKKSFEVAQREMSNRFTHTRPLLDDNEDGVLAAKLHLEGLLKWDLKPVISEDIVLPTVLRNVSSAPISIKVIPGDNPIIQRVWVQIITPDAQIESDNQTISFPTEELEINQTNNRYEGTLTDLATPRIYKVIVLAEDEGYEISNPVMRYISVAGSGNHGDVNSDSNVNLADAILVLQVLCGVDTGDDTVKIDADVNGDGKLGLEEAIYALQIVSGVKAE